MKTPIFQNQFTDQLVADSISNNYVRLVPAAHFSYVSPKIPSQPELIHYSEEVAELLGLSADYLLSSDFVALFSGQKTGTNSKPFAMNYAGHQFGNWAGQLGDGRAINLGELNQWSVQLKGAGPTPYSRRGDGFAVLRSSIREHLCSEAMFHLGVPTTRSLALFLSGDDVVRDMLYNGNPALEKGAIVCRVAPSFIRFGHFELFASQGDLEHLQQLADYTITHYFPNITSSGKQKYIDFLQQVVDSSLALVLHWQRVGFVHGVMNTDNMSVHGITIDYGPYGWLEDYHTDWTPNTTDRENRRYRFGNQPDIMLWNLYQLANSLYPLIEATEPLEAVLNSFATQYESQYLKMMRGKLGLQITKAEDQKLIYSLLDNLEQSETDMTIFFRLLATISVTITAEEALDRLTFAFYQLSEIKGLTKTRWIIWLEQYLARLQEESTTDALRKQQMNQVNPKYVLRNYMAQLAIDEANQGNYDLINELYQVLKRPYEEQLEFEKWFAKRPDWARTKVGCSMLSCSS